jgi:hypothetical protein
MSQPVGPEYGLEPRRPELYAEFLAPIDSRDLVSDEDYRVGSEFGGVGGLIQPPPHVPTASERLSMIYAIDPMDDGSRPDSVAPPELEGEFGSEY